MDWGRRKRNLEIAKYTPFNLLSPGSIALNILFTRLLSFLMLPVYVCILCITWLQAGL